MSIKPVAEQLAQLEQMRASGGLTESEYSMAKAKTLGVSPPKDEAAKTGELGESLGRNVQQFLAIFLVVVATILVIANWPTLKALVLD